MGLWITDDPKADRLLEDDPFALLIGMLLDQQVPTETAFAGPLKLADRMGGLDPARIADASPDEFAALCATPPAVHRFPGSMAGRIQAVARAVVDDYADDGACHGLDAAGHRAREPVYGRGRRTQRGELVGGGVGDPGGVED